jgi:hypothetical protein
LFFAVWGGRLEEGRDAAVYVIRQPNAAARFTTSPFKVTESSFFYPRHVTSRITAQSGLFTIQKDPLAPYPGGKINQIIIKASAKAGIRRKLDAIGFHDAAIFADLDGLSRRLRFQRENDSVIAAPAREPAEHRVHYPDDPQRGRWGGKASSNGWQVVASVDVAQSSKNWFRILLSVTGPKVKLHGPVKFHLHDSFDQALRKVERRGDGPVELKLWAYGAFTVGVEIPDSKATVLELNLADLTGVPDLFRKK